MRKVLALLLFAAAALSMIGCSGERPEDHKEQAKYRRITADEAQVLMQREQDYLILDVRSPQEFAEGHIPHAVNIPMDQIGDTPPKELPDRSQTIFVYCVKGIRSMNVANRLAHMGYKNIIEMGGIKDWHGEIVK
ncbi:rhodanese-like domain-containing protein [uncultured Selenomonas sp.]|uniref:rhodanese-like domain-containing protein n=1 Tax=uncultured Selenomonas sp. TaxID=159275 RepID=UPI0028D2D8A1|nr:rhodanese-like domain-containing protein [uncultured Selenomonas sp.]